MKIDYLLTPLKIIDVEGGNVLHAIKDTDQGFKKFGEAYFSTIEPGAIKAWKRHRKMTLNLVVPIGKIKFVMCSSLEEKNPKFDEVISPFDACFLQWDGYLSSVKGCVRSAIGRQTDQLRDSGFEDEELAKLSDYWRDL